VAEKKFQNFLGVDRDFYSDKIRKCSFKIKYKIIAILSIQGISDINKKIESLKKMGLSSYEIGELLGIANVRQMKGWAGK